MNIPPTPVDGVDRLQFLFDDLQLFQNLVYREKCRIISGRRGDFESIDLTLNRPFPSWNVMALQRFHALYQKGHLHIRLLPNLIPSLNNSNPIILVMKEDDAVRCSSHQIIEFSQDIKKLSAHKLLSAPAVIQELFDSIDMLDCTDKYVLFHCEGFNTFWEVLGYVGPLEGQPQVPLYSPITEPISPATSSSSETIDFDLSLLDGCQSPTNKKLSSPPPLEPIYPSKDCPNNQVSPNPMSQMPDMVTFLMPQRRAPRNKLIQPIRNDVMYKEIHSTLCCDLCKEIFPDGVSFKVHMEKHNLFDCIPYAAQDKRKQDSHLQSFEPPPAVRKAPSNFRPLEMGLFFCRLCSHNSLHREQLRIHVKNFHGAGLPPLELKKMFDSMEL